MILLFQVFYTTEEASWFRETEIYQVRNICTTTMDIQYKWILYQGKTEFRLLTWNSLIGQFVHLVGGEEMG